MNKIIYLLLLLGLIYPKDFICHEDSEEFIVEMNSKV